MKENLKSTRDTNANLKSTRDTNVTIVRKTILKVLEILT